MNRPFLYRLIAFLLTTTAMTTAMTTASSTAAVFAQDLAGETGDAAMADQYVNWARERIEKGQLPEAAAALERGSDFADVSSDISYLLALLRMELGYPAGAVMTALRTALAADYWRQYTAAEARLLEARVLLRLRYYQEVIAAVSRLEESLDTSLLRVLALKGMGDIGGFRRSMKGAMDRYPRSAKPVRILFEFYGKRLPQEADLTLTQLAVRRLPALLDEDPELAYLAVPFMRDTEEARRLLGAYRAMLYRPAPDSLPAALNLGLLSEETALEELFEASAGPEEKRLSMSLLREIWPLLRRKENRDAFIRNLLLFNGVITEDADQDGYAETATRYRRGNIVHYKHDADQDGLAEIEISFKDSFPDSALVAIPVESGQGSTAVGSGVSSGSRLPDARLSDFVFPASDEERQKVRIKWERYPAVFSAEFEGRRYFPPPYALFYAPVKIADVFILNSLLYPERDPLAVGISGRLLAYSASVIEQPSREFSGAVERVELVNGIPQRSVETLNGRLVSRTEYRLGRPFLQSVDLDLDGRLETIRRFRQDQAIPVPGDFLDLERIIESTESDWDGDGIYETGERVLPDGRIERSWDMNGDGLRERREIK